jgi:hypothetical protein
MCRNAVLLYKLEKIKEECNAVIHELETMRFGLPAQALLDNNGIEEGWF